MSKSELDHSFDGKSSDVSGEESLGENIQTLSDDILVTLTGLEIIIGRGNGEITDADVDRYLALLKSGLIQSKE